MADNVTANAGSGGATFATDEDVANSRHVPYSKLMFGADGTFTIVSTSNPLPSSIYAGTTALAVGGGVEAGALLVTLASDSTGVITVDNAGTFAVQVDGSALTALQLIDDAIFADDAAFTLASSKTMVGGAVRDDALATLTAIEGDVVPLRVGSTGALWVGIEGTVTVGSHAVTNAGTFAVQATCTNAGTFAVQAACTNAGTFVVQVDGAALTALQLIDDAIFADDAAFTLTSSKVMVGGAIRDDSLASLTAVEGDAVPLRVDANGAQWVVVNGTVTVGSHAVTNAGTFAVQVDGTALTRLTDIETNTNFGAVTGGGVEASALRVTLASDSTGLVSVDDNGSSLTADVPAVATGGATPGKLISAATTNATSVKGSAGTLYMLTAMNTNAAARYLKFYNKATAPTVGTDTPVLVFTVPGNTAGAGFVCPIPTCGIDFSTGIGFATTTGAADSDTGAVAANEIVISYSYK